MNREWVEEESLVKALEISGVSSFIHLLPGGLDAQLADRGMSLSGGQRQSIALARTLVTSSEVLILDEPTASMDLNSETLFTQKLEGYAKDRTVIVATHRLPVLNSVDRVIVLAEGKIVLDEPRQEAIKRLTKPQDAQ